MCVGGGARPPRAANYADAKRLVCAKLTELFGCPSPLFRAQLNMMGHDMTWASFTIIEIMSQVRLSAGLSLLRGDGGPFSPHFYTSATPVVSCYTAPHRNNTPRSHPARPQERFGLKRIGFLAASQSFNSKTDVIVLCTQLLKKEFQAKSAYEIGLAINCLANIATEDLARDLLGDVVMMLTWVPSGCFTIVLHSS